MDRELELRTSRIEAFSDGVIAILITVMIFDLKLTEILDEENFWRVLSTMAPKFLAYGLSFLMIAIFWVNHHQLFHQIKSGDRALLWHNIHLLFWMSLIPFATHLLGTHPMLWQAVSGYSLVFLVNSFAFSGIRVYVNRKKLLYDIIPISGQKRILRKNKLAQAGYLTATLLAPISVYLSFALLSLVPAMYFIPQKITSHSNKP